MPLEHAKPAGAAVMTVVQKPNTTANVKPLRPSQR
jgi:hypothetical protein